MVVLNKIYTKTGDKGTTALGSGERRNKHDLRIEAYGTVDETNAAIGMAIVHLDEDEDRVRTMLARMQNDLFDLGADLATPDSGETPAFEPLRITPSQVARLEEDIDDLNKQLEPLRSFVLPGGTKAAAALHLARTMARRAERQMWALAEKQGEPVGEPALHYMNRLSDFLFVASRFVNARGANDVLWVPGQGR